MAITDDLLPLGTHIKWKEVYDFGRKHEEKQGRIDGWEFSTSIHKHLETDDLYHNSYKFYIVETGKNEAGYSSFVRVSPQQWDLEVIDG